MITLVNLELEPDGCIGFAPREKREQLHVGMFARVQATDGQVTGRMWLKIMNRDDETVDPEKADWARAIRYTGELVSDTRFDLDLGHEFTFGPEHVCEWTTVKP